MTLENKLKQLGAQQKLSERNLDNEIKCVSNFRGLAHVHHIFESSSWPADGDKIIKWLNDDFCGFIPTLFIRAPGRKAKEENF